MICTIRNGEYLKPDNPIFGLANSMFRIATGYSCAKKLNTELVCKNLPGYEERYKDNIFRKITVDESFVPKNLYKESSFNYNEIIGLNDGDAIWGYWQSEKYFKDYENEIKDLFSPTKEIIDYINKKYGAILKNSVSIHSRRGDYLATPTCHPTCDMEYYNKAIEIFKQGPYGVNRHNFLVFGDDIDWLKNNFDENFHIIEEDDVIDLYIMSMCTDNIIANSSFSWWGAWLNKNKNKKVIVPKNWFGPSLAHNSINDLIPESWRLI